MTTVAQTIAAALDENGVEVVFGLPGGETVELLDELRQRGIDFILVRNESSALFMADAYARVTGRPALCMTTLGPGAANAVTGAAHCYLDRSPVVIVTAQKQASLLPDYTHQVIDLQALFEPICKTTIRVHSGNAGVVVQEAFALATEGRPGPVHLQLSNEDSVASVEMGAIRTDGHSYADRLPAQYDADQLELARELLAKSRRPLVVAGLGVEPQRPYAALRALAETLDAPVITTPKAKGALPDDHPLSAGAIGLTQVDPVYELVDEADCVIAVGFDVVELVKPWSFDRPLIWIAPWANHDPKLDAMCELVGEPAEALTAISSARVDTDDAWGERRVARFRGRAAQYDSTPQPNTLSPQEVLGVMRTQANRDAFLAVDVGSHKIYSALEWPSYVPNRFLLSNGLSSMGYALPAAMGAALASPGSQVLCLTGDAGFAMNAGELGVLREQELPVVVVVLNDGAIDLIRSHQRRAGKSVFGTEFVPPQHAQIAAAFGIRSRRVASEEEFKITLDEFLAVRTPALIEVMLDPTGYPTTPKSA